MFATQEQFEKIGKENVEAALSVAQAQLGAFEKLASLNLELTKAGFDAWAHGLRALAGAADAPEFDVQESSGVAAKAKKAA